MESLYHISGRGDVYLTNVCKMQKKKIVLEYVTMTVYCTKYILSYLKILRCNVDFFAKEM